MRRSRISLAALALAWASSMQTTAANELFKIDPAHSTIGFKVHQFLGTVTGRFTQFGGTIDLDREHPEKSSVTATIQVKSIDTNIAKRDQHLCGEDFFNVPKFPEITFKSSSVKQSGKDSAEIIGDFTMYGVTKPLTLHVKSLATVGANEPTTRWQVTTGPLNRGEFGLRFSKTVESVSMIGDEVSINLEIEATKLH